jgi:hypothetical protein
MMLGLDEMHAGKFEDAARLRNQIDTRILGDWESYLYYLLETGLSIYDKTAQGLSGEADAATKEFVKNGLAQGGVWADKIFSASFRQTLRSVLSMNQNGWLKFYLRARAELSWLLFQINNPYGR